MSTNNPNTKEFQRLADVGTSVVTSLATEWANKVIPNLVTEIIENEFKPIFDRKTKEFTDLADSLTLGFTQNAQTKTQELERLYNTYLTNLETSYTNKMNAFDNNYQTKYSSLEELYSNSYNSLKPQVDLAYQYVTKLEALIPQAITEELHLKDAIKQAQDITYDLEELVKFAEAFDQVVEEETNKFQQLVQDSTTSITTLTQDKLDEFNTNATAQLNTYNTNATTKLEDYNTNAIAKVTELNNIITNIDAILLETLTAQDYLELKSQVNLEIDSDQVNISSKKDDSTGQVNILTDELVVEAPKIKINNKPLNLTILDIARPISTNYIQRIGIDLAPEVAFAGTTWRLDKTYILDNTPEIIEDSTGRYEKYPDGRLIAFIRSGTTFTNDLNTVPLTVKPISFDIKDITSVVGITTTSAALGAFGDSATAYAVSERSNRENILFRIYATPNVINYITCTLNSYWKTPATPENSPAGTFVNEYTRILKV